MFFLEIQMVVLAFLALLFLEASFSPFRLSLLQNVFLFRKALILQTDKAKVALSLP